VERSGAARGAAAGPVVLLGWAAGFDCGNSARDMKADDVLKAEEAGSPSVSHDLPDVHSREPAVHLDLVMEAAGAGPWVLDAQADRFWMGPGIHEMLGLPPGDTLDLERFLHLVHPDDRAAVHAAVAESLQSRVMKTVEYRVVRPDGQVRWIQARGRPIGTGLDVRLVGIAMDITGRKQQEAERTFLCIQNRAILQSTADGILGLDLEGRHVYVNPSAARMLGYEPEELVGNSAHSLWHHSRANGTPYAEAECSICATCANGTGCQATDETFWRKDGASFPADYRCIPMVREGRRIGTTVTFSNAEERHARMEALVSSETRIAEAIEIAGLGFYELDGEGRVTFQDARIGPLVGLPPEDESKGHSHWWANVHPEDLPRVLEVAPKVLFEGQDRLTIEYRYLHPALGERWFLHVVRVVKRDPVGLSTRIIGVIQDITERKNADIELHRALDEIRELRDRAASENIYLREQMLSESGHGDFIGESAGALQVLAMARRVALTNSAVLITGETGTGKELLAQAIHDLSERKAKTMVKVNCAALPGPLIESELFGREKGAYTGAMTQQTGRFQIADGSTIFLDEIGDLPLDLQVKLLRVLQEGEFQRLGSHRTYKVDVRVIAATNRNLSAMVREGRFREDLFHRLNVFPIEAPTLRSRVSDIPMLVWKFVEEFNRKMGRSIDSIPKATMERLKQYHWPGNVRELRNTVERAMIVSEGRTLIVELPHTATDTVGSGRTLADVERRHILGILESTRWRVSGKGGAAELLGLKRSTLRSRMKLLGIARSSR